MALGRINLPRDSALRSSDYTAAFLGNALMALMRFFGLIVLIRELLIFQTIGSESKQ